MRLIALHRAADGVELARDVRTGMPGDLPLLRAGTRVTAAFRARLLAMGLPAVWIHDEQSDGIEPLPPLEDEARQDAERRVGAVMRDAAEAFRHGRPVPDAALDELHAIANLIAAQVSALPEAAYALSDLASADAYTHRHSVQVAVLGLMLADRHWRRLGWIDWQGQRRFDRLEERLSRLGLGLLLHDIGKLAVPAAILDKPGPLDAHEWAVMRSHPEAGVAMLDGTGISPLSLDVVRSHHERLDGSGYPRGITGAQVHEFARMSGIADTYDAIVSERVYQSGRPPHVALDVISGDAGSRFDEDLVRTFERVAVPFPLGTAVPLPDGREGVVADTEVLDPWQPLVRTPDGEEVRVDLTGLARRRAVAAVTAGGAAIP